jgi:hypothetical protein
MSSSEQQISVCYSKRPPVMKAQLLLGVGAKSMPDLVVLNRPEVTRVNAQE